MIALVVVGKEAVRKTLESGWLTREEVSMKWISVKDKLPVKYQRVLVTDGSEVCIHYKQSCINFSEVPETANQMEIPF